MQRVRLSLGHLLTVSRVVQPGGYRQGGVQHRLHAKGGEVQEPEAHQRENQAPHRGYARRDGSHDRTWLGRVGWSTAMHQKSDNGPGAVRLSPTVSWPQLYFLARSNLSPVSLHLLCCCGASISPLCHWSGSAEPNRGLCTEYKLVSISASRPWNQQAQTGGGCTHTATHRHHNGVPLAWLISARSATGHCLHSELTAHMSCSSRTLSWRRTTSRRTCAATRLAKCART